MEGGEEGGSGEADIQMHLSSYCELFRQSSDNQTVHNSLILVGKELRDTEGLLLNLLSVITHSARRKREGERGREGKREREGERER